MDYPSIKILSNDFTFLSELDVYTSLRFKRAWQSYGDFEIHLIGQHPYAQIGNYIMIDNNADKVGIIKSVTRNAGPEGITTTLKGYHLNGIMTQRIVLPYTDNANHGYFCVPKKAVGQAVVPVPAETVLKSFVKACFPSKQNDPRHIDMLIATDQLRGNKTVWLSRYDQLDEVLQSICEYTDVGYRVWLDTANKTLVFDISTGVDRTAGQSDNSRVIMSIEYESINSLDIQNDTTKQKNVGYAAGVGEDENRLVIAVTNDNNMATGLERSEVFIDCGTLEAAETDESLSLSDEGKHKLLDYKTQASITASYNPAGSFAYERDFDLGDLVTTADRQLNIQVDKRITEIEECYEAKSISINLTFGTAPEHLNRVIKSFLPAVK